MKQVIHLFAVLALGLSLMGMSHGGSIDLAAWVKGLSGFGDAINAGEIDAIVAGFTEDGVRIHPLAGEMKGHEGQRVFYQFLYANYSDQKLVVHRAATSGNTIYVEWTWSAVHRESGNAVTLDELVWFDLAPDGRIQRMRQYFDSAAFLKQLE